MKTRFTTTLAALCFAGLAVTTVSAALSIDYVAVGNAGNAADTSTGYGAVGYNYNIGKYEVTLTQYAVFLNAVAATDTNGLYNTGMGTNVNIVGIARSGASGSYTYAVVGDGQRPVAYVSMFDAMRFANWMGNGQGVGAQDASTTEAGAYTMSLGGLAPRNAGASVFVASEDEWYKAAYYDPVSAGADALGTADYWLYATRSDAVPGNVVGAAANQVNYRPVSGIYSTTQTTSIVGVNALTPVGAFSASGSYYGTYDQDGNVMEWIDVVVGANRIVRGGNWFGNTGSLWSSNRTLLGPASESSGGYGFRLVGDGLAPVPEPTAIFTGLLCLGVASFCRRRR